MTPQEIFAALTETYARIIRRHFSPFTFPSAGNDNEAPPPEKRYS